MKEMQLLEDPGIKPLWLPGKSMTMPRRQPAGWRRLEYGTSFFQETLLMKRPYSESHQSEQLSILAFDSLGASNTVAKAPQQIWCIYGQGRLFVLLSGCVGQLHTVLLCVSQEPLV